MADAWGGSWGASSSWAISWGGGFVPPPASSPIPGSGGGHRKKTKGPQPQLLVNNRNLLEGRTKYDGIEELLKKQFIIPEERVIPPQEVQEIVGPDPLSIEVPNRAQSFTLGDNEEIRNKLETLRAQLTGVREEFSEDETLSLLLLSL